MTDKPSAAARAADSLWSATRPMHTGDLGYYRHGFEDGVAWAEENRQAEAVELVDEVCRQARETAEHDARPETMPAAWLVVNAPDHVIRYVAEMANAATARELLGGELPKEEEPAPLLTKQEVSAMRHALGADSRRPGFRNYYNADEGDELMQGMVRKGMMFRAGGVPGGSTNFSVTDQWRLMILGGRA